MMDKIFRFCSLTGDAHLMGREERTCDICDCEPVEATEESINKILDVYKERVSMLKQELDK